MAEVSGKSIRRRNKAIRQQKKTGQAFTCPVSCSGAKSGTRTHDLFVTNEMLYRLSYFGNARILAELRVQIWEKFPEFPAKTFIFFSPDHVLTTQTANYQKYKRHANHDRQSVKAKAGTPPPSRVRTDTPGHAIRNVKVAPLSQANSANASDRYLPRRLCNSSGSSVVM